MIPHLKLGSLAAKAAMLIGAGGLLLFGAAALVAQVRGVFEDGREMERALWGKELALKEIEAKDAVEDAREAGRAEAMLAAERAETRASAAENALRRARNERPEFDEAMRVEWPDEYFDSVCLGRPAPCAPEAGNDQR